MQLSKRTRLVLAVVFLFLLSMCNLPTAANQIQSGPPALVGPTTVFVHPDGIGDYPTLQYAVDRLAEGSAIQLDEGIYLLNETIRFPRTISLVGTGMDKTILRSNAPESGFEFEGAGMFSAEGISFEHEGEAAADVFKINATQARILNCRFSGAATGDDNGIQAGLWISGNTLAEVKNSEFVSNNISGLRVSDDAELILQESLLFNNLGPGLDLNDQAVTTASNNNFSANGYSGVIVDDNANIILNNNLIFDNEESGVVFFGESSGEIKNNSIYQNTFSGVAVSEKSDVVIVNNQIFKNEANGISVKNEAKAQITTNTIYENEVNGLSVFDQSNAAAEKNEVYGNTGAGIWWGDTADGMVKTNHFYNNVNSGIIIHDDSTGTFEDNLIENNQDFGNFVL